MDAFFKPSLVEVNRNEEPGTFGAAAPMAGDPATRNYARDEKTKNRIGDEVTSLLGQIRADRLSLHEEWQAVRRMRMLKHDTGRRYLGRSQAYVPLYSRIQGTLTTSLSRGLFPSDEYMDVIDRGSGDPEVAKPVKQYMQWEMERNARLRSHIKPFIAQYVDYGNSPLKFFYNKEVRHQGRTRKVPDLLRGARAAPSFTKVTTYDGLCVSPRSIFNWYVYPTTAASLDEATLVFEDVQVPRTYIEAMGAKGIYENVEEALRAPDVAEEQSERVQQADDLAGMGGDSVRGRGGKLGDVLTLTEVWCFLQLPRDAYGEDEDHNFPIPTRILLAGDTVVRCTRNPFWHQYPPYLLARKNVHPGFIYGSGYGRIIRDLQYLTNDSANMMNDIGAYTLNPVVKVNPAMLAGTLDPICPGRVWKTLDPNGITFDRPPVELIRESTAYMNTFISMGQDFAGAPPMLQGSGGGGSAKTATGAQILQRNALTPLQDEVEDIENDVLIPLLFRAWINAQQYREEEVMVAVAGESVRVTPEQLAINADFMWLASNQAANQQQRAQQGLAFIQALMPLIPYYQAQGKIINFDPILKRVYSSGFGWRGWDQVIMDLRAQMGAPPVGPSGSPGVAEAQGDRVRSSLEQVGGAGVEMAPGEGEDFMQVRSEADDLAGMLGGMPNMGGEFQ